jgi:hypothetical protein
MCHNQNNKLAKLESERQEWQRRIIESEREKRDFLERIDQVSIFNLYLILSYKKDLLHKSPVGVTRL